MKKLLNYIKPYWYLALLAPIFMVAEVLLDLVQPQLLESIVDNGILQTALGASEKVSIVIKYGLLMLLCLTIGGVCGISSGVCASAAANAFGNDLRKDTFSSVVDLSFEQTDKFTTGSLVTRITNDITQVQDFVAMAIRMFIRTLVMFIGGIVFMFITSPYFALILGCALPIQAILIITFLKKATPYFGVIQEKVDKVNSVVQENVNGVRVVKAYTQEDNESIRFHEANVDLSFTVLKVLKIFSALGPFIMLILNAIIIAIIYYSGIEINLHASEILAGNTEVLTVGKVMAGLTYVSMVLMAVTNLAMISNMISRASVSAKRINSVLDCVPVVNSKEQDTTIVTSNIGTVEYKNVDFSYPNFSGKSVINNFSLKINKGETIAILGATGSGKTTLVNLIPRFYDVTCGEVLVDDINVKDYKLEDLRSKVITVLQRTELFSGTIADNLRWGKNDASSEEISKVCTIAQANDFIMGFTDGYNTVMGEKGSSLSGGQKQRIAIARALLRNPEILIFDDSTSALDLATEAKLYKALRDNLGDTTVILIAQRVASAKNCDRIAVIDKGQLVACDKHEVLIKTCPIYQDIYNSQLRRGDNNE